MRDAGTMEGWRSDPTIYKSAASWITANPCAPEAKPLLELLRSLSELRFPYAEAFECTEREDSPAAELAMQIIKEYCKHGVCDDMWPVYRRLSVMFPTGCPAGEECYPSTAGEAHRSG